PDHLKINIVYPDIATDRIFLLVEQVGLGTFPDHTDLPGLFYILIIDKPTPVVNFLCGNFGIDGKVAINGIAARFLSPDGVCHIAPKNPFGIPWGNELYGRYPVLYGFRVLQLQLQAPA